MKIFIKWSLALSFVTIFVSGCATSPNATNKYSSSTPNLDKNYGEATRQSLSAQQIKSSASGDSLIQARELKSSVDIYIRGNTTPSATSTDSSASTSGIGGR
ncbi:MAG: hypothetical protein RLZ10_3095 [Bacteroidota bacterium]|jgi:hypothetical protein